METVEDPIVTEVREIRRQHAERHGYDLDRIVAALQSRERTAKDKQPGPRQDNSRKPVKYVG